MEILFKSDKKKFFINNNILRENILNSNVEFDLLNIPHLKDVKILYHYRNINNGEMLPVYYEHIGIFITKGSGGYYCDYIYAFHTEYIKDYTIVNLNLL